MVWVQAFDLENSLMTAAKPQALGKCVETGRHGRKLKQIR
jgi:hypothetical protein